MRTPFQQTWIPLAAALFVVGCGGRREAPKPAPQPTVNKPVAKPPLFSSGVVKVTNGRFSLPSPHGLILDFKTPRGQADVQSQLMRLHDVDGTLYERGKPSIHVRAPLVSVYLSRHVVILESGVTADSLSRSAGFRSDRLEWRWTEQNGLTATGNVQFRQGSAVVRAGRLVADVDLRRAVLTENPVASAPESGV